MAFSPQKRIGTMSGILFVAIFSAAATFIATLAPIQALGLSPLVIGIVLGIFYANTLHNQFPTEWETGIFFLQKNITICYCFLWFQNYFPTNISSRNGWFSCFYYYALYNIYTWDMDRT